MPVGTATVVAIATMAPATTATAIPITPTATVRIIDDGMHTT